MKILGKVIKGKGLGYKTANLLIEGRELLKEVPDGVFFAIVSYQDKDHPALAIKGMVGDLEVRLLDFEGNLYSQILAVEILEKLRDLMEFKSQEDLVDQIEEDIKKARQYFKLK
ncbi:MAG TPA: riboflavin kinase [Patescibacteria group bacterium]|nr:riboflavin kinase [Patescibacteria group bacterium]